MKKCKGSGCSSVGYTRIFFASSGGGGGALVASGSARGRPATLHTMSAPEVFRFDNSYARDLEGFYTDCEPAHVPSPRLLKLNHSLAEELGLDASTLDSEAGAAIFAGNIVPHGARPIAQVYAGHQFGRLSPQLGDGRALLLGEVIDRHGQRRDIAFKGSGRTPYSRGGDGKAALGPVLREYILGEAMHALGVPTTRALAATLTGEPVQREFSFPGAVLTRVASSHIRVGTFEFFAARGEKLRVQQLAEYTIKRHYPALQQQEEQQERYIELLRVTVAAQASLIAQWINLGFIHGVMNTDNMTLSGETIDYGPCAFMEAYNPRAVFSSIDRTGRYAYANQPTIAQWNLARLAETLLPMIDQNDEQAVRKATDVLNEFPAIFRQHLLRLQRARLGLEQEQPDDAALITDWLALLETHKIDLTLAWRRLADAVAGNPEPLRALFSQPIAIESWLQRWIARSATETTTPEMRSENMRARSPAVIPRNHRVEESLAAALDDNDLVPFEKLLEAVARPFDENAHYSEPAPLDFTDQYSTFCGT